MFNQWCICVFKGAAIAAFMAGAFAAPAVAQDAREPFTGLRAELLAGYDEGFVYGSAVGYDVQAGGLVIGAEGEITDSTDEECEDIISIAPPAGRLCAFAGRDIYGGVRVGAAVSPTTLLYGKGGYTNARVRTGEEDGGAGGGSGIRFSETLDGYRVGAGIEQQIGRATYIKGEYRYSNYEGDASKHDAVIGFGVRF
jgi:outer membrane immunogenic protein